MRSLGLLAGACLICLGGCASLGGNVKGNFICRAPDGICSPTSNIDDQAIASMTGGVASGAVAGAVTADPAAPRSARSEEHTSELQSLMRISYAVFCLKKKQTTIDTIK